jgi:predicted DNA-binding protein
MYTYIVERTQIYLTKRETAALERAAQQTGRTRSQLIREAIEARYMEAMDKDERQAVLADTAGLWSDRGETGEEYVERARPGRLGELHERDKG